MIPLSGEEEVGRREVGCESAIVVAIRRQAYFALVVGGASSIHKRGRSLGSVIPVLVCVCPMKNSNHAVASKNRAASWMGS